MDAWRTIVGLSLVQSSLEREFWRNLEDFFDVL